MQRVTIRIDQLAHGRGLPLPSYGSALAAGLDIAAAIPQDGPIEIAAGGRAAIPTGLMIALPEGFEAQIRPRSGLARDFGVTIVNAPGTIDADYRGEIIILLANLGSTAFTVRRGMRIAQMVVAPVVQADIILTDTLETTARGAKGFGSTGLED